MFLIPKSILTLHVNGHAIRTTAGHGFYVHSQGWTTTSALRVGDLLRTLDSQGVPIEVIADTVEEAVYQMEASVPPFPCTGLWPAGTMLESADGFKPIGEVKPCA